MTAYAMNGAGNAFIVLDRRDASEPARYGLQDIAAMVDVHPFDQLIVLDPSSDADADLRVWNSDGGEVGACGNGTRAAAWLLFEQGLKRQLSFTSAGGPMRAQRLSDGAAEVDLGPARLDWREIPLSLPMETARLEPARWRAH